MVRQLNDYLVGATMNDTRRGDEGHIPVGTVDFGHFRRLVPISKEWGFDRGLPIDRYYIERFLQGHAKDIHGHVLEVGDDGYTRRYGGDRVTHSDVLNLYQSPGTTIQADLASAPQIPSDSFDCIILTQTLQLIYDLRSAVVTLHRILRPCGVLLATFPGITHTQDGQWSKHWCWSLTPASARRLFGEVFPQEALEVEGYGNVLSAISFLHGIAAEELDVEELDFRYPAFDVTIALRASKPL
jgi:SAM-dependent methyltransferase